jgi:hypothetical protein
MTLSTDDRLGNYERQNGDRPLTKRQLAQAERVRIRGFNKLDREISTATAKPEGVTLPELGLSDQHSRDLLEMGWALHRTGKHVYGGTVTGKVIAARRAGNKRARVARRAGRR